MAPRVDSVLVCDAATIREGLLHVLGAGITRMWRPTLPAPLGIQVAILAELFDSDLGIPIQLQLTMTGPSGSEVVRGVSGFLAQRPPKLEVGESLLFPLTFDLRSYSVPEFGKYVLRTQLGPNSEALERVVYVLHTDEINMPTALGLAL